MKKKLFSVLKILLGIVIAILLMYVVFRQVDWQDFWTKAASVNYFWVYLSIGISSIAYVARAYRWNLLLEPLGHSLTTSRTAAALMIGYLANLALPRLGEITRCGVLNRNDRVPMSQALGTVVAERVVDVLSLAVMIMLSLVIEADRLLEFLSSAYADYQVPGYVVVVLLFVGLLLILTLLYLFKNRNRFSNKLASLVQGFVEGLISLRNLRNPVGFILSTIIIWVTYYFMSYVIVFSLPETAMLDWKAGVMLLVVGAIAISLPVQSGFGTYHGMVAGLLLLYSIDLNTGIFLATLLHTSQIVAIGLFGGIAVVFSALIRRKMERSRE